MELIFEYLSGIIAHYSTFFSWESFYEVITDPVSWGIIFWLLILEGLLSCDNALVLAVIVKRLPEHQQKRALIYGIWGAYIFRFIAIGIGTYLIKITWVQYLGSAYLLWLALSHFLSKLKDKKASENEELPTVKGGFWNSFWGVVITIELMDIVFSVDSILAAFALSDKIWVLFLGGMMGILMMRGVATVFMSLLDKFPELESAAYVLIAVIGSKLLAQAMGYHLPLGILFALMTAVLVGTILIHYLRRRKNKSDFV